MTPLLMCISLACSNMDANRNIEYNDYVYDSHIEAEFFYNEVFERYQYDIKIDGERHRCKEKFTK